MDTGDWPQVVIDFPDWRTAESTAVNVLRPALTGAEEHGLIRRWFFIRKAPSWRVRYLPADDSVRTYFTDVLNRATSENRLSGWRTGIYEPESVAFGGEAGMRVAHELFHHDSRHVLTHLARPPASRTLGCRELGVLLCSVLMRAAGQDWYEQGDVWRRVARQRPIQLDRSPSPQLRTAVRKLMTVDVGPGSDLVSGGPLADIAPWILVFEQAGQQLAELAGRGALERGLRAVLTHHVIFQWNRLGLPYTDQHTLALLTSEVVMGILHDGASTPGADGGDPSVREADTQTRRTPDLSEETATRLRNALVDKLRDEGTVRSERVEAALRAVPRHAFVPGVPLEQAYADDAVYTKQDSAGVSISAASQPTVAAMMLEQLQPAPGQRVLELGAGTGYNAALLGHLVGDEGQVTTIDVDDDIVTGARNGLAAAGTKNVQVLLADGALGHPEGAPYERIIATVGVGDLPLPWLDQLAPGGRLVVPLRLRGGVSRSIAFDHGSDDGRWLSRNSLLCTFMPLRGIADDARRIIRLTADGMVCLHANREQAVDESLLSGVLETSRSEAWTGVLFRADESFEWLDLWLTCVMDNALSRMPVEQVAIDEGLVRPQFGWGAMAVADKGDLAYLTLRPQDPDAPSGNRRMYEVGVIGHGPTGRVLTDRVADAIGVWDQDYRSRPVEFEIAPVEAAAQAAEPVPGRFVFERPNTRLIITWQ
ncbi:methyltransferase, FxLD system [Actinomadura bangladeshensis]|uniref:Protein-L-isoaspartate O-methyltransferase n=1 Tax=Actinomadura bangladeshensis TaxID=453573 RepID=A0A6L9QRB6_9ACTN|nr:methyltransferase, FxLD system [Actinomadura bangladeshensis]NEA27656.1 methyltransferase, FxLD system [Actinomadura bangladeshensis]